MNERYKRLVYEMNNLQHKIEVAEETNRKYDEYHDKYFKLTKSMNLGVIYRTRLENLLLRCKTEYSKFREDRLSFLEEAIQESFDSIFPDEKIIPKLEYEPYRGKNVAKLKLIVPDGYGGESTLQSKNASGLQKQLISFLGAVTVCDLLGLNKIFIDEAFGNSSTENKQKLGKILQVYSESGMQVFLISQDVSLYQDLTRREIHIEKSVVPNKMGVTKVKEIKDWR